MALFTRSIGVVFAVGMIGGGGVLMMLPPASSSFRPEAQVAAPPPVPCKKQTWPMTDRQCQSWTASAQTERKPDERSAAAVDSASGRAAVAVPRAPESVVKVALRSTIAPETLHGAGLERESRDESVSEPPAPPPVRPNRTSTTSQQAAEPPAPAGAASAPEAVRAENARGRGDAARKNRSLVGNAPIPVTATASDGSRRTIVIRPTSQQDIYYYAARRDLPAAR